MGLGHVAWILKEKVIPEGQKDREAPGSRGFGKGGCSHMLFKENSTQEEMMDCFLSLFLRRQSHKVSHRCWFAEFYSYIQLLSTSAASKGGQTFSTSAHERRRQLFAPSGRKWVIPPPLPHTKCCWIVSVTSNIFNFALSKQTECFCPFFHQGCLSS